MSSLELYLPPNSESSYTCFFTMIAIIMFAGWTQMKIHLMYAGDLDRYNICFEKRINALEDLVKKLIAHEVLLEENGEKISLVAEDIERYRIAFEKRISALEYLFPPLSNEKEKPPV